MGSNKKQNLRRKEDGEKRSLKLKKFKCFAASMDGLFHRQVQTRFQFLVLKEFFKKGLDLFQNKDQKANP